MQVNVSQGEYTTTCNCTSSGGPGAGMTGGAVIGYPIRNSMFIVGEVAYQNLSTAYDRIETRLEYLRESGTYVAADVERVSKVSLAYLTLHTAVKWKTGLKELFITVGPTVGMRISGQVEERETILTPGLVFDDTGSREKEFLNADLSTAFPTNTTVRASIDAGLGYEFHLTPRLYLLPQIRYAQPLTNITAMHPSWKIATVRFLIQLEALL